MKLERVLNVEDMRAAARHRLPRVAFDYIEGGVEDEVGLLRNRTVFDNIRLLPRYLVDVSKLSRRTNVWGNVYDGPFGISPTGAPDVWWPGAERFLAEAAAEANVPFLLSTTGINSVETAFQYAGRNLWFQLYVMRDRNNSDALIGRARDAGVETLVVTVDNPVSSNRERIKRSGFSRPLRKTLPILMDGMFHPSWTWNYLRTGGMPVMGSFKAYAPPNATADALAEVVGQQLPVADMTWSDLSNIRRRWPGKLVVKGIMHPEDAVRATEAGADGIYISNHGGRQLDYAPATTEVLPAVRQAVPDQTIMIDGGFRRGSHIVMALALGADFVFLGRPLLYGVGAFGKAGANKVVSLLNREIDLTLGQIGCTSIAELDRSFVAPASALDFSDVRAPILI